MVLQGLHFWDVAGDLAQILLCLLILGFFIKNRQNQRNKGLKNTIRQTGKSFDQQVFTQAVQQQIDQTFTNIMESLTLERGNLESKLGLQHQSATDADDSKKRSVFRMKHHTVKNPVPGETAAGDQRHEKIKKFAARGLSARKISDDLKIPLNEVEFVLSLQKK